MYILNVFLNITSVQHNSCCCLIEDLDYFILKCINPYTTNRSFYTANFVRDFSVKM